MSFNLKASQVLEAVKKQVSSANFRARNYGLADTFTVEQWLTILNEWGWKCAEHGILVNGDYGTNPSREEMREMLDAMRELVADWDARYGQ